MKKYVIFDLDGTLLDSMEAWEDFGNRFVSAHGCSPKPGLCEEIRAMSIEQAADYLIEQYPLDMPKLELIESANQMIEDMYAKDVELKPAVKTTLEKMKKAGIRMCIATATDGSAVHSSLGRLGVIGYFDFILTCSEIGYGKDQPHIYQEAARRFGVSNQEIAVFEDSLHCVKTAKAAGFYVIGVYDKMSAGDTEEIQKICDEYLYSFKELDWNI